MSFKWEAMIPDANVTITAMMQIDVDKDKRILDLVFFGGIGMLNWIGVWIFKARRDLRGKKYG